MRRERTLLYAGTVASPFALGAGLRIVYDVLLYVAFRNVRPPEERERITGPRS